MPRHRGTQPLTTTDPHQGEQTGGHQRGMFETDRRWRVRRWSIGARILRTGTACGNARCRAGCCRAGWCRAGVRTRRGEGERPVDVDVGACRSTNRGRSVMGVDVSCGPLGGRRCRLVLRVVRRCCRRRRCRWRRCGRCVDVVEFEFPARQDQVGIVEGPPATHVVAGVAFPDLGPRRWIAELLVGDVPQRVADLPPCRSQRWRPGRRRQQVNRRCRRGSAAASRPRCRRGS